MERVTVNERGRARAARQMAALFSFAAVSSAQRECWRWAGGNPFGPPTHRWPKPMPTLDGLHRQRYRHGQSSLVQTTTILTLTLFLSIGSFDFADMVVADGSTLCEASAGATGISDRAIAAPLTAMISRFIFHSMFVLCFR